MVEITKDYSFDGPHGKLGLIDLSEGRTQLLISHYARDTSFAAVSRAPLDKLERYKQRMGWTIPWCSSNEPAVIGGASTPE